MCRAEGSLASLRQNRLGINEMTRHRSKIFCHPGGARVPTPFGGNGRRALPPTARHRTPLDAVKTQAGDDLPEVDDNTVSTVSFLEQSGIRQFVRRRTEIFSQVSPGQWDGCRELLRGRGLPVQAGALKYKSVIPSFFAIPFIATRGPAMTGFHIRAQQDDVVSLLPGTQLCHPLGRLKILHL